MGENILCALPGKLNKNVLIIAEKFNLDIYTLEQAETLLSSVAIVLLYQLKFQYVYSI